MNDARHARTAEHNSEEIACFKPRASYEMPLLCSASGTSIASVHDLLGRFDFQLLLDRAPR
jgi:hypothetical protein